MIGNAKRNLVFARLSTALESLLNAGVPIVESWELAAAASGSPKLKRIVGGWRPRIDDGATPAQLVSENDFFPSVFAQLYNTGEISGGLDDALKHLHSMHLDNGTRQLRMLCQWFPRLIYLGIMLVVAYRIISFYTGYFSGILGQ